MSSAWGLRESLRVMSFNIRYGTADDGPNHWSLRQTHAFRVIRNYAPHLIGLQEVLAGQLDELRTEFEHYSSVGVGRDDGRAAGEYAAILFDRRRLEVLRTDTFWFSYTPTLPNSMHWGNQIPRICTWAFFRDLTTGAYLWHYNLHLDHESQPSREDSVRLLLKRIDDRGTDDPVVVTGDFNAGEQNPCVRALAEVGFSDSFREVHPFESEVGTFNGYGALEPEKIDYIFASMDFRVASAEIVRPRDGERYASDHFPVTAELVF